MNNTLEQKTLLENRQNLYLFLSTLYLSELDGEQLARLRALSLPPPAAGFGNETLNQGFQLMGDYFKGAGTECLDELAVDYARVFLSAGVAQGLAAFPYESIYTNSQHLMAQEPAGDVAALYAAKGLKPAEGAFKVPLDHIGLECAFMEVLCGEALGALEGGSMEGLLASLGEQRTFLRTHLLNWHRDFCQDLEKYAATGLYRGLARITQGFLTLEEDLLNEGDAIWDTN
jgi:anaerobic sulfite reductase subunit A